MKTEQKSQVKTYHQNRSKSIPTSLATFPILSPKNNAGENADDFGCEQMM